MIRHCAVVGSVQKDFVGVNDQDSL